MNRSLRLVRMSRRQAWPWRWELALLELGCQRHWRLPDAVELKAHAQRMGERLQAGEGAAALAFDGYTLVAACWRDEVAGDFGPCAIPGICGRGIEVQLQAMLASTTEIVAHIGSTDIGSSSTASRGAGATSAGQVADAVRGPHHSPGIAQVDSSASSAPMTVAASTSLG